jgi:hypothetical protein
LRTISTVARPDAVDRQAKRKERAAFAALQKSGLFEFSG